MLSVSAREGRIILAARSSPWAAALGIAALWAAGARAQESDTGETTELPSVDIVAERPASQRAPSAQSTVVEVARFAGEDRSVAELLSTAPGVSLHATGGPGQATTLSLRGASADESLVLLDGIPLQGPGGGAIDLTTLPSTLLSRIVVSRGVLGAQLGAGALGGAVELIPRRTQGGFQGGAQVSFGSYDTAQVAADLGGDSPLGTLTVATQLDRTSGDYLYARQLTPSIPDSPYTGERRENADARRGAGLVRVSGHPFASGELDVLFQGSAGERGVPGPAGSFTPHTREEDEGGVLGGRLRGTAGAAIWALRGWTRGDRIALRGMSTALGGDCVPSPDCPAQISRFAAARTEGELSLLAPMGQWISLAASGGGEWLSGSAAGRRRRSLASFALSDEVRLFAGALLLNPALRADAVAGSWETSPGLAATLRPFLSSKSEVLRGLELRGGVGRSFRPASFAELYLEQGALAPNPALLPERATSLDGGVRLRIERAMLSASLFTSRYQDLILYEQFPPARVKPFNIGSARIAGAEIEALVQLPEGFSVEAAYSLLDAVNRRPSATESGQKLAYRPPHRIFARGARRGDRLEGFLELSFTSAMPRNNFGTGTLPAQMTLNAGAGVRAAGPVWLDLEVRNLLDDRTREDLFQYPLPGIALTALARARL